MIDKELLAQTVAESIKDTDIFIVDITIGAENPMWSSPTVPRAST